MKLIACLALLLAAGCKERNPAYCDGDNSTCPDPAQTCNVVTHQCEDPGQADASIECGDSDDCPAPAPICEQQQCAACTAGETGDGDCAARDPATPRCAAGGNCVQCLDSTDCGGTTPVCDVDAGTCQACVEHDDCLSEVCEPDGSCLDPDSIVYVDGAEGTDDGNCGSQASPCATLTGLDGGLDKVGNGRRTVRISAGTYDEELDLDAFDVTLIGPGAILHPSSDVAGIRVRNGVIVVIDGLTVEQATGPAGDGIRCEGGASLTVRRAVSRDNSSQGVDVVDCVLVLERSRVLANNGGGVRINDSDFTVSNNFVVGNGQAGASGSIFGGVLISNGSPFTTQVFEFNTVADSISLTAAPAAGVQCTTSSAATLRNSIVYLRSGGAAMVSGTCAWAYSDVEGGVTGDSNIDADPLFANVAGADVHIAANSPCRNVADPAATRENDIDGDVRPEGGRRDMGADEVGP